MIGIWNVYTNLHPEIPKSAVFLSFKHVVHYDCIDNPCKLCQPKIWKLSIWKFWVWMTRRESALGN